jgi:formate hydrogenlyase subunit 3/multisubunit Na+/H+ antiporter MnhD subunit
MAGTIPWILISILVLLIILGIFAVYIKRKYKRPTDYYTLFTIGIVWAVFGLFMRENMFLFWMGIVFMVAGISHKDEWKKNHIPLKKKSKEEQNLIAAIMIVLGVLVLLGFVALFLVKGGCI